MRISELSERSGVPLSSIKFYIREGLVPAGERRGRNQARYAESHLERLQLIRTLREVAGLSIEQVRRVVRALEAGWDADVDAVETALAPETPSADLTPEDQEELERLEWEVRALVDDLEWSTGDWGQAYVRRIARGLLDVRRSVLPDYPMEMLRSYADVAWRISEFEQAGSPLEGGVPMPGDDLDLPVRLAVLGTLLLEPILLGFRSYAHTMRAVRRQAGLPLPPVR